MRWCPIDLCEGEREASTKKLEIEGAQVRACRCKQRLESVEEGARIPWTRWMGYWGCPFKYIEKV
jgi:hypothetical protein